MRNQFQKPIKLPIYVKVKGRFPTNYGSYSITVMQVTDYTVHIVNTCTTVLYNTVQSNIDLQTTKLLGQCHKTSDPFQIQNSTWAPI